jgi:hypothetical protein
MKKLDKKPQVSGGPKFIFARLAVLYRDLRMEWRGAKASFASKKLSASESHEVSAAPFRFTAPGRAICTAFSRVKTMRPKSILATLITFLSVHLTAFILRGCHE